MSTDIKVNQAGYLTRGEKRAIINFPCEKFQITDTDGKTVYEGDTEYKGYDEAAGDEVYLADFSDFCTEGEYYINAGGQTSLKIRIGDKVYKQAFDSMVKAYYYWRCGSEITSEYAGEFTHPACHLSTATEWGSKDGREYDVSGGWHDAGDYGRYVTAGSCAVAHLLYAYRMYPDVFISQKLDIPRCENFPDMPDLLHEVKYELLWLLKMQREDGSVWHKCTTANHAPFVMPQEDNSPLYLFAPSSMAAADFAAVMSLAAGVYKGYDSDFSEILKAAAIKSGEWLLSNPEYLGFHNPEGCNTGGYDEPKDFDNRFWAYCELYTQTGDKRYYDALQVDFEKQSLTEFGYGCVSGLGSVCCLLKRDIFPKFVIEKIEGDFRHKCEVLRGLSDKSGYGVAMFNWNYCWGSNMNVGKNAMTYIIADYFGITDGIYDSYITRQADYLFGINAVGISFVTGTGENCCKNPHLRPAVADGIERCIPGYVEGGVNANRNDYMIQKLIPEGTPAMKCYADNAECYSVSEVAIYWNSPNVFMLAKICGE